MESWLVDGGMLLAPLNQKQNKNKKMVRMEGTYAQQRLSRRNSGRSMRKSEEVLLGVRPRPMGGWAGLSSCRLPV